MDSTAKVTTCIMLAPALRDRLDDAAAVLDRSRSWVAGRAIELFLSEQNSGPPSGPPDRGSVGQCPAEINPDCRRGDLHHPWPATSTGSEMNDTPDTPGADPVRANRHLHLAVLERANALATERATEQQKRRDQTAQRTAEYLKSIGRN